MFQFQFWNNYKAVHDTCGIIVIFRKFCVGFSVTYLAGSPIKATKWCILDAIENRLIHRYSYNYCDRYDCISFLRFWLMCLPDVPISIHFDYLCDFFCSMGCEVCEPLRFKNNSFLLHLSKLKMPSKQLQFEHSREGERERKKEWERGGEGAESFIYHLCVYLCINTNTRRKQLWANRKK